MYFYCYDKLFEERKFNKKNKYLTHWSALAVASALISQMTFAEKPPAEEVPETRPAAKRLTQELSAYDDLSKSINYRKAGSRVSKTGKVINFGGTALGHIARVNPEPDSRLALKIAGGGMKIVGAGLKHLAGPMLDNHADCLEDRALQQSPAVSISEAIDEDMDRLAKEREIVWRKYAKATKLTRTRKLTDKLRLTSFRKRMQNAQAKYGAQLKQIDSQMDKRLVDKAGITKPAQMIRDEGRIEGQSTFLKEQQANTRARIDELRAELADLAEEISTRHDPARYQNMIARRERELIRLIKELDD